MKEKPVVGFIHPDLGIGGAERLIIDAAVELKKLGYEIYLYTAHHDVARCFEDTIEKDGKRCDWIRVHGSWIPRHIFGFLHVFCANLRCFWLTIVLIFLRKKTLIRILIVDQVSLPILIIRSFSNIKTIFYCHYPDLLLAPRNSRMRKFYRFPFDLLEKYSTLQAHKILVNSKFTAQMFLDALNVEASKCPDVLYPSVKITFDKPFIQSDQIYKSILTINRFERKKDIFIAIYAYVRLLKLLGNSDVNRTRLLIAGGYDSRIIENVEYRLYYREVKRLTQDENIFFLPSINSKMKREILAQSLCLLYTPVREHFGIVPLEAMGLGTPVIAVNNGGPTETIVHDKTGFLCNSSAEEFAMVLHRLCLNPILVSEMGKSGRSHVEYRFARSEFGSKLSNIIIELSS